MEEGWPALILAGPPTETGEGPVLKTGTSHEERAMEEEIRKAAIRRYILQGESPKSIYISLNRSKQWFYKWLQRYHSQGKEWHKNKNFSGSDQSFPVNKK